MATLQAAPDERTELAYVGGRFVLFDRTATITRRRRRLERRRLARKATRGRHGARSIAATVIELAPFPRIASLRYVDGRLVEETGPEWSFDTVAIRLPMPEEAQFSFDDYPATPFCNEAVFVRREVHFIVHAAELHPRTTKFRVAVNLYLPSGDVPTKEQERDLGNFISQRIARPVGATSARHPQANDHHHAGSAVR